MTPTPPHEVGDQALLRAWEVAHRQPPWYRPLALLDALAPAAERGTIDQLPLGAVACRAVAAARVWAGPVVELVAPCQTCGERMEVAIAVDDLLAGAPADPPATVTVEVDGHAVTARLPRPADVAGVASAPTGDAAAVALLERTLVTSEPPLGDTDLAALVSPVAAAMEAADPLGLVSVRIECPVCGATGEAAVDLIAWCWTAAEARAARLIDEVHRLALAYGWSEAEILSLGPGRRAAYLERVP